MPQTRSQTQIDTNATEGKQNMATSNTGDIATTEAEIQASKDPNRLLLLNIIASKDPNHLLLLNIIANQKASGAMHEQCYTNLDTLIQASNTTLVNHIKENDKVINTMTTNIEVNTKGIKDF